MNSSQQTVKSKGSRRQNEASLPTEELSFSGRPKLTQERSELRKGLKINLQAKDGRRGQAPSTGLNPKDR